MLKKLIYILPVIIAGFFFSCDDKDSEPQVIFDDNKDYISDILPGDLFLVKGKIVAENGISQAFYFHQKDRGNGIIDEDGDRLIYEPDGSFSLGFNAAKNTIGVKIIVEDTKGNRIVRIFRVELGSDELIITFDDPQFIEDIAADEEFYIKGKVVSKTKITNLTYKVIRGEVIETPVEISITDELESALDITLTAKNGMSGVLIEAKNKGGIETSRLYEIKNVTAEGPVILFDTEEIKVKPNETFTVTGSITSEYPLISTSYVIVRGNISDPALPITLTDDKFSFDVYAGEDVTGIVVIAEDAEGGENQELIQVSILFPEAIIGNAMVHFKNIILTAERYPKSYFSFNKEPYIMNKEQATANQADVHFIYLNCFISTTSASNGPAIIGPNGYSAGTVQASDYVEGWNTLNFTRLVATPEITNGILTTFDAIGDTQSDWTQMNEYLAGKMGNSSVIRLKDVSVGYTFGIGYGGTTQADMTNFAIAIVRGKGGNVATSQGDTGDAWIELEIKRSK